MGTAAKIMDSMMTQKLSQQYLLKIICQQHDFMKGRSTLTNLMVYSNYIANASNIFTQVDLIYLDFKKAFYVADHNVLIYKLYKMGIKGFFTEIVGIFSN